MNEVIEYLEGSRKNYKTFTYRDGIDMMLASDPIFDFIMKLLPNSLRLKDFQEFVRQEPARLQSADKLLVGAFRLSDESHVAFREFILLIRQLSNSPVKTVSALLAWADHWTDLSYYTCLILAHCYQNGLGVIKSEEKVLTYLEKAIVFSEKKISEETFPFITEEFLEDFTVKNNDKKILCYSLKLLELKRKEITIPRHPREHAKNMAYLDGFLLPGLTTLDEGNSNHENQKSKILELLEIAKKKRIDYKIAYYTTRAEELTKYSLSQQEYLSLYNALNEDKDLKDFTGDIKTLFDGLDKLSDFKHELRDYENATRFGILLSNISKSPKVAIKLGERAANGHLVFANMPEQSVDKQKLCSNFDKALEYYELAIDQALHIFDIETATLAIQQYLRIESNVPLDKRINLESKLKSFIDRLLSLETEAQRKDFLSSSSSNFLKTTLGQETEKGFIDFITQKLIVLLLQLPRASENLSYLQKVYLKIEDRDGDGWIKMVASSVKYDPDILNDPAYKAIVTLIQEMLPKMTDLILANADIIALISLKGLIRALINHNLDINPTSQMNDFSKACNQVLTARLCQAARENNIATLTILKKTYKLLKGRGSSSPFSDRTDEVTYWLERSSFESTFKEGKKTTTGQGVLFNIYALAASKKANERYSYFYGSFLYRLKNLGHREAFLKIAELSMLECDTKTSELVPEEIGINIVKAISCQQPADNLGLYTQLALEKMKTLKDKVADGNKFNVQDQITVRFCYALALLIANPKKYKDDNLSLFEGTQFYDTRIIPVVLGLFNDPILAFPIEVKREVLTKIEMLALNARNIIHKKLQLDTTALLAKLPPPTLPVETTATPAPSQDSVSAAVDSSFYNHSLTLVDLFSAMCPIPVFPRDNPELIAQLKSELDSLRLLYQQSLIVEAQKDGLLQQKEVALVTATSDHEKAQREIHRLNQRATKFLDLRSKFVEKQKALAAELEEPLDSDEEGSVLLQKP